MAAEQNTTHFLLKLFPSKINITTGKTRERNVFNLYNTICVQLCYKNLKLDADLQCEKLCLTRFPGYCIAPKVNDINYNNTSTHLPQHCGGVIIRLVYVFTKWYR